MSSGILFTFISYGTPRNTSTSNEYPFSNRASTNPSYPTLLEEDVPIYDTIPNRTVYYNTQYASASSFQVVWQKCTSGHSLLLQLYPTSSYTGLLFQMGDWIIIKPDYSRILYVGLDPQTMETSQVYIGWEEAAKLTSGAEVTGSLSDADYVDAYEVHLDSTKLYDVILSVPVGADYDLYIQSANYSASGYTLAYLPLEISATLGLGVDETFIDWSPDVTGDWIVIVACENGTGTYSLTFTCKNCPIPINPAMIFLGFFIGLLIYARKVKKPL